MLNPSSYYLVTSSAPLVFMSCCVRCSQTFPSTAPRVQNQRDETTSRKTGEKEIETDVILRLVLLMHRVHSFISLRVYSTHPTLQILVHISEKKKQQERGIETVLALAVLDCFSFVKFSFAKNHVSSRTGWHTATNLLLTGCRSSCSIQPSSLIPVLLFCGFSPPLLTQFKSVSCSSISSAN